jgi:serine/threonine-protein kinase RsbW
MSTGKRESSMPSWSSDESPIAFIVRAILERALSPEQFATAQQSLEPYTRDLLFAHIVHQINQVVSPQATIAPSAPLSNHPDYPADPNHCPPETLFPAQLTSLRTFLQDNVQALLPVLEQLEGSCRSLLTTYRLKILARVLCNAWVVLDPQCHLALDYLAMEDRAIDPFGAESNPCFPLDSLLKTVAAQEIWIAKGEDCTLNFLWELHQHQAYFVVHHPEFLGVQILEDGQLLNSSASGESRLKDRVFEQQVQLPVGATGLTVRLVWLQVAQSKDTDVIKVKVITNLPLDQIPSHLVIHLAQYDWNIAHLVSEIVAENSLAEDGLNSDYFSSFETYHKPIVNLGITLLAQNLFAVAISALRWGIYQSLEDQTALSYVYFSTELRSSYHQTIAKVPEAEWQALRQLTVEDFSEWLKQLAVRRVKREYLHFGNLDTLSPAMRSLRNLPDAIYLKAATHLDALTMVLKWFDQLKDACESESIWLQCKIALAEGFTNAVRHAHKDYPPETPIELETSLIRLQTRRGLEIRIWDQGSPFNLWKYLEKISDPSDKIAVPKEGGYGLKLMQEIADYLNSIRTAHRNCLVIVKYFD